MASLAYRYLLDLSRLDGRPLGQVPMAIDWVPATEWGRLVALRCWGEPARVAQAAPVIQPVWHEKSGAPFIAGLRVLMRARGLPEVAAEIPLDYFRSHAVRASRTLVDQKKIEAGDRFNFAVSAFPDSTPCQRAGEDDPDFEEMSPPLPLLPASFRAFLANATPYGEQDRRDLPVFVPQPVLDEVIALTEAAGPNETGSILLGRLRRDDGDLFLEITAQIPARHTEADTTKLAFTAETWSAVEAAIALRRGDEQWASWFHSHPARYWCQKDCPPEAKEKCPLGTSFFSSDDCSVHRAIFWRAHNVALLVTNAPSGLKLAMYGWRQGLIVSRGFHILNSNGAAQPLLPAEAAPSVGDQTDETSCHS